MFAITDIVPILFGSMGGLAALVVAVNTWLMRRETHQDKVIQLDDVTHMHTFETSQLSLQSALARADVENTRLREENAALRRQIEETYRVK